MRKASVTGEGVLTERIEAPGQVPETAQEAALPPYLESLLAHLRLLVGIPFDYLVPDAQLLPEGSIRFFYLDRSWTDRLVDGVLAVGKVGTREQAHHQVHAEGIQSRLDQVERVVRSRQRRLGSAETTVDEEQPEPADIVTGFLLRSALVSGWPHLEVRAFDTELSEQVDADAVEDRQLKTLRLERLSPSLLLALFEGVPKLVWLEEPHNGIQLGVRADAQGFLIWPRGDDGVLVPGLPEELQELRVPVRAANERVLAVEELAARIATLASDAVPTDVSDHLAVQLLRPPWRQRFQGGLPDPAREDDETTVADGFVPTFAIAGSSASLSVTAMRRLVRVEP